MTSVAGVQPLTLPTSYSVSHCFHALFCWEVYTLTYVNAKMQTDLSLFDQFQILNWTNFNFQSISRLV